MKNNNYSGGKDKIMSTPTADSVHKIIDDHYRTYIMPAYERHEEYLEKINKKLNMTESSLESIKRSVSKQEQELEDMKKKIDQISDHFKEMEIKKSLFARFSDFLKKVPLFASMLFTGIATLIYWLFKFFGNS